MAATRTYYLPLLLFSVFAIFTIGACDSDPKDVMSGPPTGTVSTTVGTTAFVATSITVLTPNDLIVVANTDDGRLLTLSFIDITTVGQYPLISRATTPGPGVAGGYSGGGETYNIDSGMLTLTSFSDTSLEGTFEGTARGLFGAADLPVTNGSFDIDY